MGCRISYSASRCGRSPRVLAAGALSLLLILACRAGLAATALQSTARENAKLAQIEAEGSARFSGAEVAAASGLKHGQEVTPADFQAAANRLAALGTFDKVLYRYASEPDGVHLEFRVHDAPAVPILFDNFPWFTDAELIQALKNSVVLFDGRTPRAGAFLDEISDALAKTLETRGVHASVQHELVVSPLTGQEVQQFHAVGASLNVNGVEFTDSLAAHNLHIRDELFQIVGKPFSRLAIERFIFEQVRPVYLEHAHLHAQFVEPQARFTGNPFGPRPNTVLVIVSIHPGPAYTWDGIAWSGNTVFSSAELNVIVQTTGLSMGGPADGVKIFQAWENVQAAYGHRGYLDAQISPVENFDDAKAIARYRASITEGSQYQMGNLVLSNMSDEAANRVRKAWRIQKGQVFDNTFYKTFLAQGIQEALTGLPVHYEKIGRWLQKDPTTHTVDVLLDFE